MDSDTTRTLRELLTSAESALGGKSAAEEWVFRPLRGLGGISPAEAIQHKSQVKGVWQKLGREPPRPEAKLSIFPVNIAS